MIVTCESCGLEYDDVYRWTYCPHATFEMRTVVGRRGQTRVCRTVEELLAWLDEEAGSGPAG
jgi:hypothetical protein